MPKKSATPKTEPVAVVAPPAVVETKEEVKPVEDKSTYAAVLVKLNAMRQQMGVLVTELKGIEKQAERDLKAARESFEAFRTVLVRFPASKYADDSRARMRYLVNAMAGGEVHIARYYFTRGAYLAAVNRAQGVVAQYQDAPAIEEALYIMVLSYDKLGLQDLRADAERVLRRNFPKTELFARGLKLDDRSWWEVWR